MESAPAEKRTTNCRDRQAGQRLEKRILVGTERDKCGLMWEETQDYSAPCIGNEWCNVGQLAEWRVVPLCATLWLCR